MHTPPPIPSSHNYSAIHSVSDRLSSLFLRWNRGVSFKGLESLERLRFSLSISAPKIEETNVRWLERKSSILSLSTTLLPGLSAAAPLLFQSSQSSPLPWPCTFHWSSAICSGSYWHTVCDLIHQSCIGLDWKTVTSL